MGSSRTYAPAPKAPKIPQPTQNALVFRDGKAYDRTGGMNTDSKRGVEASPFAYKPLGYTAQEAGYFGPGRYGAARRYGQDSVTNPDVPQVGNYYPAGGSNQMQFADQASQHRQSLEQARAEAEQRVKSAKSSAKKAMVGGAFFGF